MANRISVLEGASETTRWAGPVRVISRPSPSVKTGADVGVACGAHAVIKAMTKVSSKNLLNIFSPFYCKESKSPAECWGGWRGNPSGRPPPPFRERVVEPTRAGDLTY